MKRVFKSCLIALAMLSLSTGMTHATERNNGASVQQRSQGMRIVTNHPDLEIKLKRCQVSGKTCVIDFIMTNYGSDTSAQFYTSNASYVPQNTRTKAFDDEGNIYEVHQMGFGGTISGWPSQDVNLLNDTPVRCRIEIEGVSASATLWKRILLTAKCGSLGLAHDKPIMFYNVPITREGDE